MIPKDRRDIISPAVSTPRNIKKNDFFGLRPSKTAIKLPVHAPVPGSGIATNRKSPR